MSNTIELVDDTHCYVCGKANIHGLQLKWETKGHHTKAEYFPAAHHQGWRGIVHGGLLATVLDEAMTRLAWQLHGPAMTAEITVRFFNPARTGEKLIVTGEVSHAKGKLISAKSEIRSHQGRLIATATGKILKIKDPIT